jgi:hypothetical protein
MGTVRGDESMNQPKVHRQQSIIGLYQPGWSKGRIAPGLQIDRATVRKYLTQEVSKSPTPQTGWVTGGGALSRGGKGSVSKRFEIAQVPGAMMDGNARGLFQGRRWMLFGQARQTLHDAQALRAAHLVHGFGPRRRQWADKPAAI